MIVSPAFAGKKFGVLGLARSGMATANALLASGAQIVAWDRQEEARASLADRAIIADPMEADLSGWEAIVVSPGVPLNTHPLTERAKAFGVPLIGDVELFARARQDLPPHRVVGVTGTNGKSTTVALVHHLLTNAAIPARLGGNIGLPILSREPLAAGGVYVLELSSYQIDLTRSLACEVAALTNITPDHLDRYASFEDYAFSKGRLFAMQGSGQPAIFGCSDAASEAVMRAEQARRGAELAICAADEGLAERQANWPALQGPHNLQNAAIAIACVQKLGLSRAQALAGLKTFRGLSHRMEVVGKANGIAFVNDSKATNPASSAPAVAAYPPGEDGSPRVHWIVGGLAKSAELEELEGVLGNVACAYTIGEAGPRFAELLEPHVPVERAELMAEAVRLAIAAARPGDVVLLSPASASFDQFRDYEARGEAFRDMVTALTGMGGPRSPRMEGHSAA